MNAHIPQSYEATAELAEIAAVPMQIIRPRDSMPVIGVVQDALAGAYLATLPGNKFTRREYMNMMMKNKRFKELPQPRAEGRYTGQQIVGTLLPPINLTMPNKMYLKPEDLKEGASMPESNESNLVKIREGDFLQGTVDKGIFNTAGKGILHTIYNDYGPKAAVELLDGIQNMMEIYLIMKGFSVGVSDLIADDETHKAMQRAIMGRKKELDDLLLSLHTDLFTNNSGKSNQEEFEGRANAILSRALGDAGKIGVQSLSAENRLMTMVRSGSKGDENNVAQMISCVGQVAVEGKRIPYGFTDRTLPHFKLYDDGAEARGFVESSFLRGLSPTEFFFHAMAGREGLIDTAVKTADTGYTQRQLIKAMENLMTQHDGTIRDGMGKIIQFRYGEDGISSTKLEGTVLPLNKLSDQKIKTDFGLAGLQWEQILAPGTEKGFDDEAIEKYVQSIMDDRKMYVEGVLGSSNNSSVKLNIPIGLERALLNIKVKFNLKTDAPTDLSPGKVLEDIQTIIDRTQPFNKIWAASLRFHLAPHKMVVAERFTRAAWDALVETIVVKNWKSWATPGELVGIVAAQSIGEPATQMTLNSVDWDTEIVIAKNGKIQTPQIGEFIDDYYMNCADDTKIQHLPNGQIYIPLDDGNDWKAISCDEDGNIKWTKLEAITRHPVINEDGTDTIIKVTLESGREVKATKGKSFLTLQSGKILGMNGSELKVGDKLPITNSMALNQLGYVKEFNLREILSPKEYLYGSEVEKALETMRTWPDRHWFQKNNGSLFTVPYSRSDSFRDAFVNGKNSNDILPGNVYTKHMKLDVTQIPETIPLTSEVGFFMGAYLAEGMSNKTQVCITNNEDRYLDRIKKLMDSWNVGTHMVSEDRHCDKTDIKGHTTSLIIHSTILSKVMSAEFGRVSYEKTIPNWVQQAPDEFVKGLVDGYISGDGYVEKKLGMIHATSVSEKLLVRLSLLLSRYGIYTTMSSGMPKLKKFKTVSRNYTMTIPVKYSKIFYDNFNLSIEKKQNRLNDNFGNKSRKYGKSKWSTTADVVWDKIKSIEELRPMKDGWVYDLTVESTRNFMGTNRIGYKDTFHQAGVASKSAVTRGVPRLKELLKVTKNPKATSITIALKPAVRNDRDVVRQVGQDLELTLLKDIIRKAAIYYDPRDADTMLPEDRDVIKFFKLLEMREYKEKKSGEDSDAEEDDSMAEGMSKWILRFEFDKEKMYNKNITMDDVYFVVQNAYGFYGDSDDNLHTIYSDYNSQKLIMRIRPKLKGFMYGDDLAGIKKFLSTLLQNTIVRGVGGIRAVTWRKDNTLLEYKDGEYKQVDQYLMDTDGSNFVAAMCHPCVDGTKLYSTNVHDIYEQLGIEATRVALYSEISGLFDPGDINYRHLGLLCDTMCLAGRAMSVDRYGINKMDSGPLAKACFEETEKVLKNAALFGEMDPVTGVSANIMMGQPIRAGTAFTQILLDEDALVGLLKTMPAVDEEEEDEEEGPSDEMIDEVMYGKEVDPCARIESHMNMILPNVEATLNDEEEIEIVEIQRKK